MLNPTKKSGIKDEIITERKLVAAYKAYELGMKETIEAYLKALENVSFENDSLKTMILNNFENTIMQLNNNLLDIDALNNVIDILDSQEDIAKSDIITYNKLAEKSFKDIELTQNLIQKTVACFQNINLTGTKKSMAVLEECQKNILADFPFSSTSTKHSGQAKHAKVGESSKSIQKSFDYSSSDLLCFFPKEKNDNLIISTVQDDYKISFKDMVATIFIENENFNISLTTPGVQISNSKTNNLLFVACSDLGYTIITNNQMEIPSFIQVSKISKNDDFLEVEIPRDSLSLLVKDNIINFQEDIQSSIDPVDNSNNVELVKPVIEKNDIKAVQNPIESVYKEYYNEPEKINEVAANIKTPAATDDEIVDNDTLIISDSNKSVILPYTVFELEQKLHKNKNYKTLRDVINKEYTIPIDTFKNPVKSRFREAFQLIKKKEHGSLKEAIGLGFELMFQSDLNPAVIAACKDLDQLDIYLDCLDDNELDKFSCFKILYNVPPSKQH